MNEIELLQQIGLNKYEAEAYTTLLKQGPLTGYELGKRSQVPLSRSYEILERLVQRGLALVQPGEPPRYLAEKPEYFLGRVRSNTLTTLDTLVGMLVGLTRPDAESGFWVTRGRSNIVRRAQDMLDAAKQAIELHIIASYSPDLTALLARGRAQTTHYSSIMHTPPTTNDPSAGEMILLLIDGREGLIGSLASGEQSQAISSGNYALVTLLNQYFLQQERQGTPPEAQDEQLGWLAWEERKQRGLWKIDNNHRVA